MRRGALATPQLMVAWWKLKDGTKKKIMDEQVSQIQTRITSVISTIEFYKIQKNNELWTSKVYSRPARLVRYLKFNQHTPQSRTKEGKLNEHNNGCRKPSHNLQQIQSEKLRNRNKGKLQLIKTPTEMHLPRSYLQSVFSLDTEKPKMPFLIE